MPGAVFLEKGVYIKKLYVYKHIYEILGICVYLYTREFPGEFRGVPENLVDYVFVTSIYHSEFGGKLQKWVQRS